MKGNLGTTWSNWCSVSLAPFNFFTPLLQPYRTISAYSREGGIHGSQRKENLIQNRMIQGLPLSWFLSIDLICPLKRLRRTVLSLEASLFIWHTPYIFSRLSQFPNHSFCKTLLLVSCSLSSYLLNMVTRME